MSLPSFKKIDLVPFDNISNWSRLRTYYGNQDFYNKAVVNGNLKFL
jgi:hypothetical protein